MRGDTPELKSDTNWLPGIAAGALFVVLAVVILQAEFPAPEGFPEGAGITASIGYAMFNLTNVGENVVPAEGFLVAFEIIDVVLVAALVGAVMLARREDQGNIVTALTDGGRRISRNLRGADDDTPDGEGGDA